MPDGSAEIKKGRKFDQVLAGARDVFMAVGFEGASVDDIARKAGVSKATLYSYFPDKRILFMEVAKIECNRQADQALYELDLNAPMREILGQITAEIVSFFTSSFAQRIFRICVGESERFPEIGRQFYESGPAMVRAAYSSGKPTLAVGAGNVPAYVHASKRDGIGEVAEQIVTSKAFDYGTACVSEQAVIADRAVARELRHEMKLRGAYFMAPAEADRLAGVIFTGARAGDRQQMDPERVGQSPQALADAAGFSIPPRTRALVSEETEIGWQRPLSAEKLNPVLAFYEARDEDHGLELSRGIAEFEGWGHTSVIHAEEPQVVARFSALPTGRVLVNTPAIMGGMGYSTDLEPSFMLGTGTWSGSITSDNVTALSLINIKRVAYESRPWRDIYEQYGE